MTLALALELKEEWNENVGFPVFSNNNLQTFFFLQNKTKILKHICHILNIVRKYREFLYLYIIVFYIATVSLVSIGTVYSYI